MAKKILAPIAKLRAAVEERGKLRDENEATAERRAANGYTSSKSYRDGLTAEGRRKFLASTEDGNPRAWLCQVAAEHTTKKARVGYIAELMAQGEWKTPLSIAFAKVWNCSVGYVRSSYASEASRLVEDAMGNQEQIRNTVMMFLERVAHDAFENGDRRSAVTAARTFAEIAGIIKHKTEITGADGGPIQMQLQAVRHMTDDELRLEILKAGGEKIRALANDEGRELTSDERKLLGMGDAIPDAVVEDDDDEDV